REEDQERMQRESEAAALGDWQTREQEFLRDQARQRAAIRIKAGRAQPIDILAMNLRLASRDPESENTNKGLGDDEEDDELDIEIDVNEPTIIFEHLNLADAQELLQDIEFHFSLAREADQVEFWNCLRTVCQDKIDQLNPKSNTDPVGPNRENVAGIFTGKNHEQLLALEAQINAKLAGQDPVDMDYWETVRGYLKVHLAIARLHDMHEALLQKRLGQLREKQVREALREQEDLEAEVEIPDGEDVAATTPTLVPAEPDESKNYHYRPTMSPRLVAEVSRDLRDIPLLTVADDARNLHAARLRVLNQQFVPKKGGRMQAAASGAADGSDATAQLYREEMQKGLGENEIAFTDEAKPVKPAVYLWQDKYRPRKPRYFNRIHSGYEWNQFNRTHYDVDNPPPKIVQGYKFNIFYPDLIDKSVTPSYTIEPDPESDETVILRFTAGPPYEDVAFRIINKQWERTPRRGFRNVFDRGVLKLYFRFKRHFYRR
ncbi:cactus-binding C-terminus of cactin protein-domain-containing protein, partial [Dimargaris cristalligena]